MKKTLLFIAAGALVFTMTAKPASAGFFWAPKAQLAYGFSDSHDAGAKINPAAGGGVIVGFGILNMIAVEANASFMYWFSDTDNLNWYMVPVHAGIKVSPFPLFGIVGGLGFTSWTIDSPVGTETEVNFSFYAGLELSVFKLFIRPQILFVNNDGGAESTSFMVEVGWRF